MNRLKNGLGLICALSILLSSTWIILPANTPEDEDEPPREPAAAGKALRAEYLTWQRDTGPTPWQLERRWNVQRIRNVGREAKPARVGPNRQRRGFDRSVGRPPAQAIARGGDSGAF